MAANNSPQANAPGSLSLRESVRLAGEDAVADAKLSGLLRLDVVALARELASDINDEDAVLQAHGFTGRGDPHWIAVGNSPEFTRLYTQFRREWESVDSTPKRIRAKAQAAVEAAIAPTYALAVDGAASDMGRMKALEHLIRLSGTNEENNQKFGAQGAGGGGFSITINMATGDSVKVLTAAMNTATGASIADSQAVIESEAEEAP